MTDSAIRRSVFGIFVCSYCLEPHTGLFVRRLRKYRPKRLRTAAVVPGVHIIRVLVPRIILLIRLILYTRYLKYCCCTYLHLVCTSSIYVFTSLWLPLSYHTHIIRVRSTAVAYWYSSSDCCTGRWYDMICHPIAVPWVLPTPHAVNAIVQQYAAAVLSSLLALLCRWPWLSTPVLFITTTKYATAV